MAGTVIFYLLLAYVAWLAFAEVWRYRNAQDDPEDIEYPRRRLARRLAIAAVVLYFGSKLIVQSAPVLGLALGLAPLATGLVVVAIGTALPEVVIAAIASRQGQGDVVAGQVLGACLVNLLLVVGGMAIAQPLVIPASFVSLELPAAMAFALALYPIIGGDLTVSRREGGILLALFAAWLAFELVQAWT